MIPAVSELQANLYFYQEIMVMSYEGEDDAFSVIRGTPGLSQTT
jgi:hypothetical protein